MVRRKRREEIDEYHLHRIDDAISVLRSATYHATLTLKPFKPHYDAIDDLERQAKRTLNVLNGRPADYEDWGR
jgi:hypothetical protein